MTKTTLILGAAGFIGSNLSQLLLSEGHVVYGIDNFCTGNRGNLTDLISNPKFKFIEADLNELSEPLPDDIDYIFHLASPASPPKYMNLAVQTMEVNTSGTKTLIQHALRTKARLLFASTSEVYGDPLVHPQLESYWGNVNPIGPRSVYDEAKRFGETLISYHQRETGLNSVIVRIFNTYGPGMDPFDGRVVSTFIRQALNDEPVTIFGDGLQTRSFCFVTDLCKGLLLAMQSSEKGPINLGNPEERTLKNLIEELQTVLGKPIRQILRDLPEDDPQRRKPDITVAQTTLGWNPIVDIRTGLSLTADWMKTRR